MEGSNLVNFFQDVSAKLEPNCNPLKLEPNVNVDSGMLIDIFLCLQATIEYRILNSLGKCSRNSKSILVDGHEVNCF